MKDGQKILLEMAVKANIVYDKDQCAAIHVPIEGADERPPTNPPPEGTPVAEGQGGEDATLHWRPRRQPTHQQTSPLSNVASV